MQALKDTELPVAHPHCLCEDDGVIGSMFYVMSFEDGHIFWDPALPEVDRDMRTAIHEEMIRVLATIHNADVNAVGLGDYGKPGNCFERQFSRWTKQYRAAETDMLEAMESLMSWLGACIPDDDGQVNLIHGDYRLDNVMFANDEARALAVLDWELSTLGHPMADLAYLCMCMRLPRTGQVKGLAGLDLE